MLAQLKLNNQHTSGKVGYGNEPKQPSSGDSKEGVITSILMAVNIVWTKKTQWSQLKSF